MQSCLDLGFGQKPLATMLRVIAGEREAQQRVRDRVSWVWSGPSDAKFPSRDTSVVVQELFKQARRSVLLMTYAFEKAKRPAEFSRSWPIAWPSDPRSKLLSAQISSLCRISRKNTRKQPRGLRRSFRQKYGLGHIAEGLLRPTVSLTQQGKDRASLHAKILVVDSEVALVTSANFTRPPTSATLRLACWFVIRNRHRTSQPGVSTNRQQHSTKVHLSLRSMKSAFPGVFVNSSIFCEACNLGRLLHANVLAK